MLTKTRKCVFAFIAWRGNGHEDERYKHFQMFAARRQPRDGLCRHRGFAHQLVDGLISEAREISEQLALVHEIRSGHFGNRENPQAMSDVFQELILEQGGKGGCPLGACAGRC